MVERTDPCSGPHNQLITALPARICRRDELFSVEPSFSSRSHADVVREVLSGDG